MAVKESITKFLAGLKSNLKNIPDSVVKWGLFIVASMAISLLMDKLIVGIIQRIDIGRLPGDAERALQSLKEFGQAGNVGLTGYIREQVFGLGQAGGRSPKMTGHLDGGNVDSIGHKESPSDLKTARRHS